VRWRFLPANHPTKTGDAAALALRVGRRAARDRAMVAGRALARSFVHAGRVVPSRVASALASGTLGVDPDDPEAWAAGLLSGLLPARVGRRRPAERRPAC